MRPNALSQIVHGRLADLGLASISTPAIALLEASMAEELRKLAAKRISVKAVSRAILKAHSLSNTASVFAQIPAEDPKP
jgi:hypothetical protein